MIVLYVSSCECTGKKVTCSGFNDPLFKDWFPYQVDNKLQFKNVSTADSILYNINSVDFSKAFETTRGGIFDRYMPCDKHAAVTGGSDSAVYPWFHINYHIAESGAKKLEIYLGNTTWQAGEITTTNFEAPDTPFTNSPTKITYLQNFIFANGNRYPQIVVLTGDTVYNKTDKAYKVFIAKNKGIIGYEIFPSLQQWVIQ